MADIYYAEGEYVLKKSKPHNHPDGLAYVFDGVDGAKTVAALMNAGERAPELLAALRLANDCLLKIIHNDIKPDHPVVFPVLEYILQAINKVEDK